MEINGFWKLIDAARSAAGEDTPFGEALVDELAALSVADVFAYERMFDELHAAACRWDLWAAAYLIGGGCSDDGFMDFRAGLIAQGRDWYDKALADPDSLAGHPATADPDDGRAEEEFFQEEVNYAAAYAFRRLTGDEDGFHEAYEAWCAARDAGDGGGDDGGRDMGEDFDFDDPCEMSRRLPRLTARYPGASVD